MTDRTVVIFGLSPENTIVPVGDVIISDCNQVSFSDRTPKEISDKMNAGLELPKYKTLTNFWQRIIAMFSVQMVTLKPGDEFFLLALNHYNELICDTSAMILDGQNKSFVLTT